MSPAKLRASFVGESISSSSEQEIEERVAKTVVIETMKAGSDSFSSEIESRIEDNGSMPDVFAKETEEKVSGNEEHCSLPEEKESAPDESDALTDEEKEEQEEKEQEQEEIVREIEEREKETEEDDS